MRCGAGTSVRRTSGRSRAARRSARACANSADWPPGTRSAAPPLQSVGACGVPGEGGRAGDTGASPMLALLALGSQPAVGHLGLLRRAASRARLSRGGGGRHGPRRCALVALTLRGRWHRGDLGPGPAGRCGRWPPAWPASVGLVCFYAALVDRDDGRRRADRRAGARRARSCSASPAATGRVAVVWVGMVVAVVGAALASGPELTGAVSRGRCVLAGVAAVGLRLRAVLPRPRGARLAAAHAVGHAAGVRHRLLRRGPGHPLARRGRARATCRCWPRSASGTSAPTPCSPSRPHAGWSASPASWARSTRWSTIVWARVLLGERLRSGAARRGRAGAGRRAS